MSETPVDVEAPRRRFIKNIAGVAAVIPIQALATAPSAEAAASAPPASLPPGLHQVPYRSCRTATSSSAPKRRPLSRRPSAPCALPTS